MKFGPIPVSEATGAILAHSVKMGGQRFKKGRVLSDADVEVLHAAGSSEVIAARLDADDIGEDQAAERLARALCGDGLEASAPFTGRCNLFALHSGLLLIDRERLDRINLVDEALTVATLEPFAVVGRKEMVATIKIIPFAVKRAALETCEAIARAHGVAIRVAEFSRKHVGVIQTRLVGLKESILDKTTEVLRARLEALDAHLLRELRCDHEQHAVAAAIRQLLEAGAELVMIVGASAIVDRRDVLPAAIADSGGEVLHYGMPVDPGQLLLLGRSGGVPVLGLPGCARSPKFNGFDMVLQRLLAGIEVGRQDIMRMGVGGLLKEIASRPTPRAGGEGNAEKVTARAPRVAALVLAGGQSRRMGPANKLLVEIDGAPMVARTVHNLLAAQVESVTVVTGHQRERVEAALAPYRERVAFVHNPAYAEGISTSLRAGLAALPDAIDAVLVCLGDMPRVLPQQINRLIAAFDPVEGRAICVPTSAGKRGNPVLWARRFFAEMREIAGDAGAKHLLGEHADLVCEVEMNDAGVLLDIDSPLALAQALNQ
ncbi:MAG: molybdopterin-binding/glycosyltransferase family 2 protein [Gammaproteobacteria bacterium]